MDHWRHEKSLFFLWNLYVLGMSALMQSWANLDKFLPNLEGYLVRILTNLAPVWTNFGLTWANLHPTLSNLRAV